MSHTPRGERQARSWRGQALVEFALVLPILLMLIGGIIQYGVIFATKHSLIQVARDTGRWAATQTVVLPAAKRRPTRRCTWAPRPPDPRGSLPHDPVLTITN